MKPWTWGVALLVASAEVAAGQPGSPPPPEPPVAPPPAPGMDTPQPSPPLAPTIATHRDDPPADTGRPTELAFGIGVGYTLPTSLQTPNTTSVRLRLPSGLTFEPQLVFATTSDDVANASSQETELSLGSLVRYPLRVRRKVDLELVGNASVGTRVVDPRGDNNNRTITTLGLGYGVAIAYWLSPHWSFSLTASNPLLAYSRTHQEMGVGLMTTTRTTTIGLVFDPQVALMIHLYD